MDSELSCNHVHRASLRGFILLTDGRRSHADLNLYAPCLSVDDEHRRLVCWRQAFLGIGGPAVAGDILVTRDTQNRVDAYTAEGVYKFGSASFDCGTGNTINLGSQFGVGDGAIVTAYG